MNWYELLIGFGFGVSFTLIFVGCYESQNDDRPELIKLMEAFANTHTYIEGEYGVGDTYMCRNYSHDFAKVARERGFEIYEIYNEDENHAYNCVAIEPQSGGFRRGNYTNYNNIFRVDDKADEVINPYEQVCYKTVNGSIEMTTEC